MAKVNRNTIQNALDEFNKLEYELSFDEQCRELDQFEKDDWQSELEPDYDPRDDYYDYGEPYYGYVGGDF